MQVSCTSFQFNSSCYISLLFFFSFFKLKVHKYYMKVSTALSPTRNNKATWFGWLFYQIMVYSVYIFYTLWGILIIIVLSGNVCLRCSKGGVSQHEITKKSNQNSSLPCFETAGFNLPSFVSIAAARPVFVSPLFWVCRFLMNSIIFGS